MKYKKGLTIKEVLKFCIEYFKDYELERSIYSLHVGWGYDELCILRNTYASAINSGGEPELIDKHLRLISYMDELMAIYVGLRDEATNLSSNLSKKYPHIENVTLVPYIAYGDKKNGLDIEASTYTRESIAQWFVEFGKHDMAKKIDPKQFPEVREDYAMALESGLEESLELNKEFIAEIETLRGEVARLKGIPIDHNQCGQQEIHDCIPIKGNELQTLYRTFQDFPSRFPDYKTRDYSKKIISEWLDSAYGLSERHRFIYANILREYYLEN